MLDKQRIEEGERHALLSLDSPFLKDIVYYTNKNSVNLFAEALGELISPTDYARTVKVELSHIGIDSCGITLKDASGLSPANAVPAEVFTDLLIWAKGHLSDAFGFLITTRKCGLGITSLFRSSGFTRECYC